MSTYRDAPPPAPAPRCPRDGSALTARVAEDTELHVCPRCAGVWIDLDALVRLLGDGPRMDGLALHPLATPAAGRGSSDELDFGSALACVRCGGDTRRHFYGQTQDIVVDSCEQHGMWLDGGELNAILRYARGEAEPLPGDALAARRAALRGTPRKAPAHELPPPPRSFEQDEAWLKSLLRAIFRLWWI